ncbi:MAG: choice-of-anchor tandem repeat GloVer-containing protein [Bacteroidia bacterium]
MKRLFYVYCLTLVTNILSAQVDYDCSLYGTTFSGGANGYGTIFKYDIYNNTLYKTDDFSYASKGAMSYGSLILAPNGNLYGMTWAGGTGSFSSVSSSCHGCGTLFSVDTLSGIISKKYDFDYAANNPGSLPVGALINASDGNLYGMTESGANNISGALFKYDLSNDIISTVFDFNTSTGNGPSGSLLQANDGKLYGMTGTNGALGYGTLFSYDISTGIFTKLFDFDYSNTGGSPLGSLIQASDGFLYGMLPNGGSNGGGVIFRFDIATNSFTKMVNLPQSSSGSTPFGDLLEATNGKLYGLTPKGGANNYGTLFEYDIASNTLVTKFDFTFSSGKYPQGTLMQASNRKLYGVTMLGGNHSGGTLFEYDINAGTFTKKADFSNSTGMKPQRIKLVETCKPVHWEPLSVTIPNVFSPNGDNVNDYWTIIPSHKELLKDLSVSVYDRWGQEVFRSEDKNFSWNGRATNGENCTDGTYYYVLKYTDQKKQQFSAKGFLTLTR